MLECVLEEARGCFSVKFREGLKLELKRQIESDIVKTVIAFANTNGGTIYVGVGDENEVIGVQDLDAEMLKVSNMIRDTIKPDVTLFVSCESESVKGKHVIKISVQKGTESPYYLRGKGLRPEGVYVRQGASSVPATRSAIRKMIKEADGDSYEEMRSLCQELTFEAAAEEFEIRGVPFGASQHKTLMLVNSEDIYTNLALLLSDQCVHSVKVAVFQGTDQAIFKDRCEFGGSLLKQLNDVYRYISMLNRTRAEFSGLHRIDRRDYPEEALREALLNSLVHRDYSSSSNILISIFDDRIEFISAGGLAGGFSLEDIMLGMSVTRNARLANVFFRLKLIEAYGTGIPKIFRSYVDHHLKPKIEVSDNVFKITLPNKNVGRENDLLSEQEQIVVDLAKQREEITRKEVEKVLGVSQSLAGRVLRGLVHKGILETLGAGRNTSYTLAISHNGSGPLHSR